MFKLTGHLQWPKWKAISKTLVYILITAIGYYFIGNLIYIYVLGHPILGLLIHIFWCKKHSLNWINTDKKMYIESQKKYFKYLKGLKEKKEKN